MFQEFHKYRLGELLLERSDGIPPSAHFLDKSDGAAVDLSSYGAAILITNATVWIVGKRKYVAVAPGAVLNCGIKVEPGTYKVSLDSHYNVLEHGMRVAELVVPLGERLGLEPDRLRDMALAARVHDLSITAIEEVLWKPGDLSAEELVLLKQHPERSVDMIKNMKLEGTYNAERVADCVLHHHEHWDGSGYPDGLSGEQIALEARIVFVADAYDAMMSWRPHPLPLSPGGGNSERRLTREPHTAEQALSELRAHAGRRFDPEVVDVFASVALETHMGRGRLARTEKILHRSDLTEP